MEINPQIEEKLEGKPDRNSDGTFAIGREKTGGKEKGYRSFEKDFDEVIEDIADKNNISPSDARKILLKVAYNEAKNGVYTFHRDIMDRLYGKVIDRTELTGKDGADLFKPSKEEQDKINQVFV